ncbi:unnamed protein product [Phytophthora fragariaefolia]|uniref:Unnamed protein product n=1 Tax=Phytophthora fragariaefolia TaxID=1490495 RepID=A0A9W6Y921_9STRA|nr:unnamed protein product [Phytophthora fragariaefolia]
MTHRYAKVDDVQRYDLIVERAVRQQHYHLMQAETKKSVQARSQTGETKQFKERPKETAKSDTEPKAKENTVRPPKDGCFICKGPHRAFECPTGTSEQKEDVRRTLAARKAERLKHVRSSTATGHTVTINGVLEVPFCADSGADSNIISQAMVQELGTLDSTVVLVALEPPVMVKVAGGAIMSCHDRIDVDLRIETAAGPLNIARVS